MSFFGVIKSFSLQSGWGHIECEQTFLLHGKDIFLLKSQLAGAVPVKGDEVWFDVTEGQKGVQAANVSIVSVAATGGKGVFVGTIKSWNPEKGWGFITCDTTQQVYEKDIFIMRSAIAQGDCTKGDQVRFSVEDGQKGPQATSVSIIRSANPAATATPWIPAQATFNGTVKGFDEVKGWGHIVCDATRALYGKDMFMMRSAMNGNTFGEGAAVQFTVAMGHKGPEARNVVPRGQGQVVPAQSMGYGQFAYAKGGKGGKQGGSYNPAVYPQMAKPQMAGDSLRRFSGTVKNWNEEKGWGFVECQDSMNVYGKDIFLHKKELYGQSPVPGSPVMFSVTLQPQDGRPIATTVALSGGMSGGLAGYAAVVPATWARTAPY